MANEKFTVVGTNIQEKATVIWNIANALAGYFKPHEYGLVILPMTIVKRFHDCLLPTHQAVLDTYEKVKKLAVTDGFLRRASGYQFYNTSKYTFDRLLADPENIESNFRDYLNGFSPNVQDILAKFDFENIIKRMVECGSLYLVIKEYASQKGYLGPDKISAVDCGYIFEDLVRRFSESFGEEAGAHFTSRDIIYLMTDLLLSGADLHKQENVTVYDMTMGTSQMLSCMEERIHEINPDMEVTCFGQEFNPSTFAIAKADMMIRGGNPDNMRFGDTLSDDKFTGYTFRYIISNPPFGIDWKREQKAVEAEAAKGDEGRFAPGLPKISDGQQLFVLNGLKKLDAKGKMAIIQNGSPLFTGDAGSGPSNIRQYILENDWLEAIRKAGIVRKGWTAFWTYRMFCAKIMEILLRTGELPMDYLGIHYSMSYIPVLDREFIPFGVWMDAYLAGATQPIAIAVERNDRQISVRHAKIYGTAEMAAADYRFVERYMKFLLWSIGGFRVSVCGCSDITKKLRDAYAPAGERAFDYDFFRKLYERPLEIIDLPLDACPESSEAPKPIGGHTDGCRIGFDAGGSDRKVSAVIDGQCVYSEEVVWHPKVNVDPNYQYEGILDSFRTAASKMPRVDGIGVSSAGVFIGNAPMVSSIFYCVPRERWDEVKTVYDRAAAAIGPNIPIVVANDGDVSALAGAMGMGVGSIMGLAMGTSEAVGYVDKDKNVLGWISELAFAPVDLSENAMVDEWSTDIGVGCKYFSQDAVIKLAPRAGIRLDEGLTPAEKLKVVQKLMEADDPRAQAVFRDIGIYLAYAVVQYSRFYDLRHLMLLGRVMSGKGGDTVLATCKAVLADEFPALYEKVEVMLPDEKTRRVGQSAAAASLPAIR